METAEGRATHTQDDVTGFDALGDVIDDLIDGGDHARVFALRLEVIDDFWDVDEHFGGEIVFFPWGT